MLGRELLLDAAERVSRGWVQGVDAVDAGGAAVEPWDDAAVAWSLLGALVAALEHRTPPGASPPVSELAAACVALVPFVDHDSLDAWNDAPGRTRAHLTAALRAAAADTMDAGASRN